MDEIKFKDTTFFISRILKDEAIFCNKETYERLVNLINAFNELNEENEQLRQQQQRLYNYFRDYLEDEMSAENFGEMWDTVKVDERW